MGHAKWLTFRVLILSVVAYGGQHASKKLKMVKQGIDISQEASPARFINFIANRDRGRKCKSLKVLLSFSMLLESYAFHFLGHYLYVTYTELTLLSVMLPVYLIPCQHNCSIWIVHLLCSVVFLLATLVNVCS